MRWIAIAAMGIVLAGVGPVGAVPWTMVAERSTLTIVATQTGQPFEGQFAAFATEIDFDPQDLAASTIRVVVDTASFDSNSSDRDGYVKEADWFAVASYPQAEFVSTAITESAPGQYVAQGTLSIKGVAAPIEMPFSLAISGNSAVADGEVTIDRSTFGVGSGTWTDESVVANAVTIRFHVEATN